MPASMPPLVSSSELVVPGTEACNEFEFGLIVTWNAFSRWVERCMAAAGAPDLTMMDVSLLNHVRHRGRHKKLADICFTLNHGDTHVVAYSLRKMAAAKLVSTEKIGKEVYYTTTKDGEALLDRYKAVRDICLVPTLDAALVDRLGQSAAVLRHMSGTYDQAARSAASL